MSQAGFQSLEPRAAGKGPLPRGPWARPASITGTVRSGTGRQGSLPRFMVAALVPLGFFLLFSFVCADEESLVRSGSVGSTERPSLRPPCKEVLSEVVRKEGFEVFEHLLLSI